MYRTDPRDERSHDENKTEEEEKKKNPYRSRNATGARTYGPTRVGIYKYAYV